MVRLGLTLELGVEEPVLRRLAGSAKAEDLLALREALEEKAAQMLPVVTQLGGNLRKAEAVESGFLI